MTDLKSRLTFRSPSERSAGNSPWRQIHDGDEFLIAEIDRSGLIRSANGALSARREPRGGAADLGSVSLLFLVHAEDRSGLSELVRETFAGGAGGSVMARLLTGADTSVAVRWTLLPVREAEGEVKAVLCLGADLSAALEAVADQGARRREVVGLRQAVAELSAECGRQREELERLGAERERLANQRGPIPGLEEEQDAPPPTLADLERRYILHTLDKCRGRVSGRKGAAVILGMHPNTLRSRMEKFGIGRSA